MLANIFHAFNMATCTKLMLANIIGTFNVTPFNECWQILLARVTSQPDEMSLAYTVGSCNNDIATLHMLANVVGF